MVLGLRRWLQLARSVALMRAVALAGAASAGTGGLGVARQHLMIAHYVAWYTSDQH